MTTDIQHSIQNLANSFVQGVLHTLTSASLSELSALAGGGESRRLSSGASHLPTGRGRGPGRPRNVNTNTGAGRGRYARAEAVSHAAAPARGRRGSRRVRRSSEDVSDLADRVAEYIRSAGGGVAVSDIAKGIDMSTADVTRPVAIALQEGKIYKTGEKRLTRYFFGSDGEKKGRGRGRKG